METREFNKKQKGNFITMIFALMISSCNPVQNNLLTQLDSEDVGIDFTNNLEPGDQLSIITYPNLSIITVNQQPHILAARHDDTILTFLLHK